MQIGRRPKGRRPIAPLDIGIGVAAFLMVAAIVLCTALFAGLL